MKLEILFLLSGIPWMNQLEDIKKNYEKKVNLLKAFN